MLSLLPFELQDAIVQYCGSYEYVSLSCTCSLLWQLLPKCRITRKKALQTFVIAAEKGDVTVLERLYNWQLLPSRSWIEEAVAIASQKGQVQVLNYFLKTAQFLPNAISDTCCSTIVWNWLTEHDLVKLLTLEKKSLLLSNLLLITHYVESPMAMFLGALQSGNLLAARYLYDSGQVTRIMIKRHKQPFTVVNKRDVMWLVNTFAVYTPRLKGYLSFPTYELDIPYFQWLMKAGMWLFDASLYKDLNILATLDLPLNTIKWLFPLLGARPQDYLMVYVNTTQLEVIEYFKSSGMVHELVPDADKRLLYKLFAKDRLDLVNSFCQNHPQDFETQFHCNMVTTLNAVKWMYEKRGLWDDTLYASMDRFDIYSRLCIQLPKSELEELIILCKQDVYEEGYPSPYYTIYYRAQEELIKRCNDSLSQGAKKRILSNLKWALFFPFCEPERAANLDISPRLWHYVHVAVPILFHKYGQITEMYTKIRDAALHGNLKVLNWLKNSGYIDVCCLTRGQIQTLTQEVLICKQYHVLPWMCEYLGLERSTLRCYYMFHRDCEWLRTHCMD